MKELRAKLEMLFQEDANCPLCGTELGIEGRQIIITDYETQGNQRKETFRTNENEAGNMETRLNTLNGEMSNASMMAQPK